MLLMLTMIIYHKIVVDGNYTTQHYKQIIFEYLCHTTHIYIIVLVNTRQYIQELTASEY